LAPGAHVKYGTSFAFTVYTLRWLTCMKTVPMSTGMVKDLL